MRVAEQLLNELQPALLLITLGELGMLLCQRGRQPFHIPTVAQEVFDVSGAGDTVIASFTAAIAAGASPLEAAHLIQSRRRDRRRQSRYRHRNAPGTPGQLPLSQSTAH